MRWRGAFVVYAGNRDAGPPRQTRALTTAAHRSVAPRISGTVLAIFSSGEGSLGGSENSGVGRGIVGFG